MRRLDLAYSKARRGDCLDRPPLLPAPYGRTGEFTDVFVPKFSGGLRNPRGLLFTDTAVVPEPSTLALFGIGAVSVLGYGWRRKRKQVVRL